MNIFHIVSNKVWGGGEQYVYDLLVHLKNDGYNTALFCRNYDAVLKHFRKLNCKISVLPLRGFTDLFSAISVACKIKGSINIIHVHNFKDLFTAVLSKKISRNRNIRIVITRHLVKKGKNGFLYEWLYRNTDKIIFVSNIARDEFFRDIKNNHNINYEVIHNSIAPHNKQGDQITNIREKYKIPGNKSILMYLGRIDREKGIEVLIKALQSVDKGLYHLIIAGTGDEKYIQHIKTEIDVNGLGNNISFTGHIDTPQQLISQSDIGILPSIAKEALGLSNLEFMQGGKPQICSNNGAQTEYLENNKTAILIDPDNEYELEKAITGLIANKEKQLELGLNARKKFLNDLSYTNFYEKIKAVYEEISG